MPGRGTPEAATTPVCLYCNGESGKQLRGTACTAHKCKEARRAESKRKQWEMDASPARAVAPTAKITSANEMEGLRLAVIKKICGHCDFRLDDLSPLEFRNGCDTANEEVSFLVHGHWKDPALSSDHGRWGHKWVTLRSILTDLADSRLGTLGKYAGDAPAKLTKAWREMRTELDEQEAAEAAAGSDSE